MNPNQQNQPTQSVDPASVRNPISAMRDGEVIICSIKRHPIGLLSVYASFILLLIIVGAGAIVLPGILVANSNMDINKTLVSHIGIIAFLVAVLLAGVFSLIANIVYYGNRWILTSDSLTQVVQNSLFSKQSSQLSLANLEDVTVIQDGILTHMFNYGIVKAETAGEHSKFIFAFCPDPNAYAQKILVARENFEQGQWYAEQRPDHRDGGVNIGTEAAAPQTSQTPPSQTA